MIKFLGRHFPIFFFLTSLSHYPTLAALNRDYKMGTRMQQDDGTVDGDKPHPSLSISLVLGPPYFFFLCFSYLPHSSTHANAQRAMTMALWATAMTTTQK